MNLCYIEIFWKEYFFLKYNIFLLLFKAIPAKTGIGGLEVARTNSRSSDFRSSSLDIKAVTRLLTLWSITEIISPVSTIGRGALWACPRGCHFLSGGNANSPVTFSAPVFQFSFFSRGLTWLTNHSIKTRGGKRKLKMKMTISANRSEMPKNWKCSLPRRARKRSGQFINSSLFFCVIRACGRWKNRRKKTAKAPKANCRG